MARVILLNAAVPASPELWKFKGETHSPVHTSDFCSKETEVLWIVVKKAKATLVIP